MSTGVILSGVRGWVTWSRELRAALPNVTQILAKRYKTAGATAPSSFRIKPSRAPSLASMFVNSVEVISSRLENIALNIPKMQPKPDLPVCPKTTIPSLHLTPSHSKTGSGSPQQGLNDPWLLKPQHEIPATPPPQTDTKPIEFFPQRIG